MRITGAQIAAARGLGQLEQKDVAAGTGLTNETISKIERGESPGSATSLSKIAAFFASCGIEFIENEGVRKQQGIKQVRGTDGLIEFLDDVYKTTQEHGGHLFLRNTSDKDFMKWLDVMDFPTQHMERMKNLKNFKFQILVNEEDKSQVSSEYAEYRQIPPRLHGTMPIYGYAHKCAFLVLKHNPIIYMIDDARITEGFRNEFNMIWKLSSPINKLDYT